MSAFGNPAGGGLFGGNAAAGGSNTAAQSNIFGSKHTL